MQIKQTYFNLQYGKTKVLSTQSVSMHYVAVQLANFLQPVAHTMNAKYDNILGT